MKVESGSMSTDSPDWYEPPVIQVHAVEINSRSEALRVSRPTNAATAPPNATKHEAVEIQPAVRRESRCPPIVIRHAATSGETKQIQAPQTISRAAC
jgi:hypothetical protein